MKLEERMRLKVSVTQEDIDMGESHPSSCPIARAVKRDLGGTNVQIHYGCGIVLLKDEDENVYKYYNILITPEAEHFMVRFDGIGRDSVYPQEFELEFVKTGGWCDA